MNINEIASAETPELVRRHVNLRIKIDKYGARIEWLTEDYAVVDELVKRKVLDR